LSETAKTLDAVIPRIKRMNGKNKRDLVMDFLLVRVRGFVMRGASEKSVKKKKDKIKPG
jgi:hypothetical protein